MFNSCASTQRQADIQPLTRQMASDGDVHHDPTLPDMTHMIWVLIHYSTHESLATSPPPQNTKINGTDGF